MEKFLPAHEALVKYHAEKIQPTLDSYKLWDHDSFKDFHRRKGHVIHSSRFLYHLIRLEPRLIVQRQINFENDWGLYIHHHGELILISGMPKSWLTEFSYTTVDERDLPSDPVWGWRHILVRLLSKNVLTWDMVIREFGNSMGANSERWQMYTRPYRTAN